MRKPEDDVQPPAMRPGPEGSLWNGVLWGLGFMGVFWATSLTAWWFFVGRGP